MWKLFQGYFKDNSVSELQGLRLLYGLMGVALGFTSGWLIVAGTKFSTEFLVMTFLGILGIVGFFAISGLIRERKEAER